MISDGYGEQQSPEAVERLLMEEEEFFVRNARNALVKRAGQVPEGAVDDAIQEARIAAWLSWTKHQNRAFMNIAVRQRMIEVVFREQTFGAARPANNNAGRDPLKRSERDSLEFLAESGAEVALEAANLLETVLMAYHDGEIVDAINSLAPDHREYVVLRFWHGKSNSEIAAIQGKSVGVMGSAWTRVIRPRLQERLAHLAGVS